MPLIRHSSCPAVTLFHLNLFCGRWIGMFIFNLWASNFNLKNSFVEITLSNRHNLISSTTATAAAGQSFSLVLPPRVLVVIQNYFLQFSNRKAHKLDSRGHYSEPSWCCESHLVALHVTHTHALIVLLLGNYRGAS